MNLKEYIMHGTWDEEIDLRHDNCGKEFQTPEGLYESPKNLKEALEWAKKHDREYHS